jgi:RimJ/RimL family protein N-acetyltransferase
LPQLDFPLETPRLLIRPFNRRDAEAAHQLFCRPELWRFNDYPFPSSRTATRKRLELYLSTQAEYGLSLWAVLDKERQDLVGDCGLIPLRWRGPEIEVGYRVTPAHWGRGLATEAALAVVEAGLGAFGLEQIVGRAQPGNTASRRVLEKVGMSPRGIHYYEGTPWMNYCIERERPRGGRVRTGDKIRKA